MNALNMNWLAMKLLFRVLLMSGLMTGMGDSSIAQQNTSEEEKVEMKQYWMVFLRKGPNRDQDSVTSERIQEAHLANIGRLAKLGKIVVAWPFGDDGDLRGIFIVDCKDEVEVRQLCETDPAIKAGRLIVEIHPWWTAKGGSFK